MQELYIRLLDKCGGGAEGSRESAVVHSSKAGGGAMGNNGPLLGAMTALGVRYARIIG